MENIISKYGIGLIPDIYGLEGIDWIKINKKKLAEIHNCSDIDALVYIYPFCEEENKELCERLITLNMETDIGEGREPASADEQEEYGNGKWKLLNYFGIGNDLGEAFVL